MKTTLPILLLLLTLTPPILSQQQPPEVTIRGSQLLTIYSKTVQQEYVLHISLPAGYKTSNKKYPVMYLMDSQWDFTLLTSLYGQQYFDGFIPEMIIVGITWGGTNPNPDSLRARDYTPTKEARLPQSGGAAAYLAFMKNELFPFIETNYKADKNERGLIGCSLGGLFTLYALFTEPGLFKRYVASSPAFGWDKEVIYQYEKNYFERKDKTPARLYMSMGGVERNVPGFEKLAAHLASRHYPEVEVKTRILENTGHSGTKGEGYARGLQYVYEKPLVSLDASLLNKYAGKYQAPNGSNIELKTDGNGLAIYFGANNKYILYAANESYLYATSEFLRIHMKTIDGKISGFQLERYGSDQFVKRVD